MSPSFAPFPCGAHKPSCPALLRLAAGRRGVLLNALIQIRGDETPAVPLVTDRPFELEALEFAGALVLEEHPRFQIQQFHQLVRAERIRGLCGSDSVLIVYQPLEQSFDSSQPLGHSRQDVRLVLAHAPDYGD